MEPVGIPGFIVGMTGGFAVYLTLTHYRNKIREPAAMRVAIVVLLIAFLIGVRTELSDPTDPTCFDRLTNLPFVELLIGFAFGAVLGEWLKLPMLPGRLYGEDPAAARKWWGIALLSLALVGILYPVLVQFGAGLSGASVTTPVGGLSLTIAPSGPTTTQSTQAGGEQALSLQDFGVRALLPLTSGYLKNDADYDDAFLSDWAIAKGYKDPKIVDDLKKNIASRRKIISDFLDRSVTPLVDCIKTHLKTFNKDRVTARRVEEHIFTFQSLLKSNGPKSVLDSNAANRIAEALKHAALALGQDLDAVSIDPAVTGDCLSAAQKMGARWDATSLDLTLPYLALSLAHIQAAIGEVDTAEATIAEWFEAQFGRAAQDARAKCKVSDATCSSGLLLDTKWVELPPWYRVRAQFDLVFLLSHGGPVPVTALKISELIDSFDELFSEQHTIQSAAYWQQHCSALGQGSQTPPTVSQAQYRATARLMYTYTSMIDNFIASSLQLSLSPSTDNFKFSGPLLLEHAKQNKELDVHCLVAGGTLHDEDIEDISGQYWFRYGTLLARMALDGEIANKDARAESLRVARTVLKEAIVKLRPYADDQRAQYTQQWTAVKQLTYGNSEQDAIDRARRLLRQLPAAD